MAALQASLAQARAHREQRTSEKGTLESAVLDLTTRLSQATQTVQAAEARVLEAEALARVEGLEAQPWREEGRAPCRAREEGRARGQSAPHPFSNPILDDMGFN